MSLRTKLLPLQDKLFRLADPTHFDVVTTKVTIYRRTWAGGRRGADVPADAEEGTSQYVDEVLSDIPQRYEVEHVSNREIAASAGRLEDDSVKVGPITPAYYDTTDPTLQLGGFTSAQLKPVGSTGSEIIYRLTGAVAGDYQLYQLHNEDAFEYFMFLTRTRSTPD